MADLKSTFNVSSWPFWQWKWLRWFFLIATLSLATLLGYFSTKYQPQRLLVLLGVGIGGLALTWLLSRRPALGLVLLVPVNMFVKYSLGTGTDTNINATILLIVLLLGVWIMRMMSRYRTLRINTSQTTIPLVIFLVVAILAFFNGQLVWFNIPGASLAAQVGGLMVIILSAVAFILAANLIDDVRWLKWMVVLLIIFGGVNTITLLFPSLHRWNQTLFAYGGNSSQYWTWFVAIVFSQAFLNRDIKMRWRIGLSILLIASLYIAFILIFDWKSGWMPAFVAIIVIVGLRAWHLGLLLGIIGLVGAPILVAQLISTDEYSFFTRIEAWQILGEIIKVNPVLGLGPANYYWYTPLYQIGGYTGLNFNSHNQYIDLVAQFGILSLIFFFWFFWEIGRLFVVMRKRVLSGFEEAYLYGAIGGLVATLFSGMMGDWSLPFVYNVGIAGLRSSILGWLFLGCLVALERLTREKKIARSANTELYLAPSRS